MGEFDGKLGCAAQLGLKTCQNVCWCSSVAVYYSVNLNRRDVAHTARVSCQDIAPKPNVTG